MKKIKLAIFCFLLIMLTTGGLIQDIEEQLGCNTEIIKNLSDEEIIEEVVEGIKAEKYTLIKEYDSPGKYSNRNSL